MHPAGVFEKYANTSWNSALYDDAIEIKYKLTTDEIAMLKKHGFDVAALIFGCRYLPESV